MAVKFPSAWIDELYARTDIVQLVSSYLPLKKKGRNHWGLCPFHNEKTPSFSVNPELNVYYCFGCQAGGNVVGFVMDMERLTYPEALEYLAKQINLPLPQTMETHEDVLERSQKERLYEANASAARYFHELLWQPEQKNTLDYLRQRGIDDATIRRFGLGASSAEWNDLSKYLTDQGFSLEEQRIAGLIVTKEETSYDMFRGRAIFPIINLYGKILGFGGRAMKDVQPKYLNTSDTPVFNKRYGLYAANFLRKTRNLKRLLLVEGYMDVIALSQFGVEGVVATLGTALTAEQARLMKRFAPEVWVAYDGDEPGQMAILRALEILEEEKIPARVLQFPNGLDPDEMIRQRGIDAFNAVKPITNVMFRLLRAEQKLDLSAEEGRMQYAKQASAILAKVEEPVELDIYLKDVAIKSGFSRETLLSQITVAGGRLIMTQKAAEKKQLYKPRAIENNDIGNKAEETLLALLASGKLPAGFVDQDDFLTEEFRRIASLLLSGERPAALIDQIEDPALRSTLSRTFGADNLIDAGKTLEVAEECIKTLRINKIAAKIDRIKKEMDLMQDEKRQDALKEVMMLTMELSKLKKTLTSRKEGSNN